MEQTLLEDPTLTGEATYPDIQDVQPDTFEGGSGAAPGPAPTRADSLRSSIDMARQIGNEGLAQDYERQLQEAQPAAPAASAPPPAPTQGPQGSPQTAVEAAPLPPIQPDPATPLSAPESGPSGPLVQGPPGRVLRAPRFVVDAVAVAERQTGVSSSYLIALAKKESSFNPAAAPGTSSARGLFQFLTRDRPGRPSTWTATMAEFAAKHGIPANTPATDPVASAIMAAEFTKKNEEQLRRAFPNRTISDGDRYLAHFAGASGAVRFLQGLQQNPNQPGTALFNPDQVAANRGIFYNRDGSVRSAQQVYARLTAGFEGGGTVEVDPNGRRAPTAPVTSRDVAAPPPVILGQQYQEGMLSVMRMQAGSEQAGFWELLRRSYPNDSFTGALLSHPSVPQADPNFSIGPMMSDLTKGLPPDMHGRFGYAVSAQHALDIRTQALRDAQTRQMLADAGWTGTGAQVLAGFLDPAAIALAVGSGGLAGAAAGAYRIGRAGQIAAQAAAGGASNVAVDAGIYAARGDDASSGHLLASALIGAGFGAMFGPVGRNAATASDAAEIAAMAAAERAALESGVSPAALRAGSVGAAATNPGTLDPILNDAAWRAVQDQDVGKGVFNWLRWSSGGQLATSQNPVTRLIGSVLAVDTTGKAGALNARSADQGMELLYRRWDASWRSTFRPAYDEWAEQQGYNMLQRKSFKGMEEFSEQVGRAVRQRDPDLFAALPEPVKRAALEFRKQMNERRLDMQDPRRRYAPGTGRAIPGSEALEQDPYYFTRVWSSHRIEQAAAEYGKDAVYTVVSTAIRRASPSVEEDVADRLARALVHSPSNRDINLDNNLSRALSSGDVDVLRRALQDAQWQLDDIERLVAQLAKGRDAKDPRLKHRVDLDETHAVEVRKRDGTLGRLQVQDLFENNADRIMQSYNRKMAGRLSLAEVVVENPSNRDILKNGIVSDADFEELLSRMKQWAKDNGVPDAVTLRDEANLRWVYDRILGRPDPSFDSMGNIARWLSVAKNFNFSRLMGQMGLVQMMDVGRLVGGVGLRAFIEHGGDFRRVLSMDGRRILKYGVDRELEAMFGAGTDALRGFQRQLYEDEALRAAGRGGTNLDRAERISGTLAHATHIASGMDVINSWGQLVTGRAAAQRFADIAAKGGQLSKAERNLVNFLGLDDTTRITRNIGGREITDTELGHVLRMVRENFSTEKGLLYGRKVVKMNMDNWADLEARHAFESALFRFSRNVWQEGDIGALHRTMSNPIVQVLLQFRRFGLVAWENQLLHGIANWDGRQAAMFMATMLSGTLVYSAQMHLQALGRSDAREFLDSKGFGMRTPDDYRKLAFSAFQRAGFASILPMGLDTILSATPAGPQFGARSTDQPADVIFGNPTVGLASDVARAAKGVLKSFWEGNDMSQTDMRNVYRLLALQNTMPLLQGYSLMISGREEPKHRN